jgi:hypothetical protein
MIAFSPTDVSAAYRAGVASIVAALKTRSSLPALPWALLTLNAAAYLDAYLPPSQHRGLVTAALSEAQIGIWQWGVEAPAASPAESDLEHLIARGADRPTLYRSVFDHAARSGDGRRLLLAQHACEMAYVVEDALVSDALRIGFLSLPRSAPSVRCSSDPISDPLLQLARALLNERIDRSRFGAGVVLLHAARRAQELVGRAYTAPLDLALAAIGDLAVDTRWPWHVPFIQPQTIALRAAEHSDPRAVVLAEAGLVEAETLPPAQQVLLWAALHEALRDRVAIVFDW